jgi:hypothetical protein
MSQDHYTGMLDQLNSFKARQSNERAAENAKEVDLIIGGVTSIGISNRGCLTPNPNLPRGTIKYRVSKVSSNEMFEVMKTMTRHDHNLYGHYVDRGFMFSDATCNHLYDIEHSLVFEAWLRRMIYLTPFGMSEMILACVQHEKGEESRVGIGSLLTGLWHHEQGIVRHVITYLFEPNVNWNYVRFYDRCRDGRTWLGNDKIIYTPVPPSRSIELPKCKLTGSKRYHGVYGCLSTYSDSKDVAPHEAELLLAAINCTHRRLRYPITDLKFSTEFLTCEYTPNSGSNVIPNYTFTWYFQHADVWASHSEDEVFGYYSGEGLKKRDHLKD